MFSAVQRSGAKIKQMQRRTTPQRNTTCPSDRIRSKREIALLKTLAVATIASIICWIPFAIVVMFFAETVLPQVKKVNLNQY